MTSVRAAWFLVLVAACSGDTSLPMKNNCNPLGFENCMVPWPSGVFEVDDVSTKTGKHLAIPMGTLPTNFDDDTIDLAKGVTTGELHFDLRSQMSSAGSATPMRLQSDITIR